MFKYIIKRLLLALLVLIGVSVILYILVRMMPTDYIDTKFSAQLSQGNVTQDQIDAMKDLYGILIRYPQDELGNRLNVSGWINTRAEVSSYFTGYFNWLGKALKGDLGISFVFDGHPVTEMMNKSMWISFWISLVALVLQYIIAIPLGITSATHQYGALDYTVTILAMMGISLPTFFLADLLLSVFSTKLGWFPIGGMSSGNSPVRPFESDALDLIWHMVLPMVTLVILSIGGLMRYTRTNMLEVLNADYIRTARAKGCSEKTVIYKHAFRNTLIPIVTMLAGILPGLFGGAMITEQVFAIDGIGNRAYKALSQGDIPFIMGYNMFLAILSVIGILLSDLLYSVVDPRVKISK